jgi:phosphoserine aminotransferase
VDATADLTSLHIIQGTFGKRWYELQSAVTSFAYRYAVDETQHWGDQLSSLSAKYKGVGFVAAVQTETSRGVALPDISKLREAFPEALIAVDATSSLGGLQFPWECADVWFASVQKCLGLPPGLALLLLLPPAVERFQGLPRNRYNSLSYLIARGMEHEPPFTPNLLAIYLVAKSLAQRPPLSETDKILKNRAAQLYRALEEKGYKSPVSPEYRAHTVLSFSWDNEEEGRRRRTALEKQGLYIGWGHGPEREHLFRIANFPALPDEAYMELLSHL